MRCKYLRIYITWEHTHTRVLANICRSKYKPVRADIRKNETVNRLINCLLVFINKQPDMFQFTIKEKASLYTVLRALYFFHSFSLFPLNFRPCSSHLSFHPDLFPPLSLIIYLMPTIGRGFDVKGEAAESLNQTGMGGLPYIYKPDCRGQETFCGSSSSN